MFSRQRLGWTVLGIASLIAGVHLLLSLLDTLDTLPPAGQGRGTALLLWSGLIGICLISALLCLFPQSHWITLRILGAYGVVASIFNIINAVQHQNGVQIVMSLLFWLPGSIFLLWKGQLTVGNKD